MKVLLDTCVIYPTVMRQMLLGVAKQGVFTPLWSARIIEEWQRAAVKLGPEGVAQAGAEAAMLAAHWWNAKWLTLAVYEHSTESRKFYERLGFGPQTGATVMKLDAQGFEDLKGHAT